MNKVSNAIIPLITIVIFGSCVSQVPMSRVRLTQPDVRIEKDTVLTKKEFSWVDENGVEKIISRAEKDSATGENLTTIHLSGVTVSAKSKQVAERNGMINLDFIVTVPSELINKKWQVQLTPEAFTKRDTMFFDKIFLSGADFAKMQKKGYLQYQAFLSSIIPDSLYLQQLFNKKGYRKAIKELEEEYYQAWKNEVLFKESWIDWSDKLNRRFIMFNTKMESNRASIAGNEATLLRFFPAYWLRRNLTVETVPGKWKMFLEGNHSIKTKSITPEDSVRISKRFYDYKRIAENQRKSEMKDEMFNKLVKLPYESSKLDTIIQSGDNFIYFYKQRVPATDDTKTIKLTLDGVVVSTNAVRTQLPPSDTLTFYVSSMSQFLDHEPRYKKKIITKKDEVNVTAYINYVTAGYRFDASLGDNDSEIQKVFNTINSINFTGECLIDSIHMTATSSPEGSSSLNYNLAKKRALNLKAYLSETSEDKEGIDTLFRPRWKGEDWVKLKNFITEDDSLQAKYSILSLIDEITDEDLREREIKKYNQDYVYLREKYYPLLRGVEFKFHLHRRNMIKDTIIMPVIDTTYMNAVKDVELKHYKKALAVLSDEYPEDYNTAICLMSLGYDTKALEVMQKQKDSSNRNYILAILCARLKREEDAVRYYLRSCEQGQDKIWRGRLDPEINKLIETYNLNKDEY